MVICLCFDVCKLVSKMRLVVEDTKMVGFAGNSDAASVRIMDQFAAILVD